MGPKWLWAALAGLIVVGVGWYFYDRAAEYRYQPVGDELLDRYAIEFLRDLRAEMEDPTDWSDEAAARENDPLGLPDRGDKRSALLLDSWEDEYGDDPRYWQLRVQVAPYGGENRAISLGDDPDLRTTKLIELIKGGMTDEGMFALIPYRDLYFEDQSKALDLIRQACDLYPDNASFHYMQASLKLRAGRPDGAWEALARGNSAPRNDPPAIYPESLAYDQPELFAAGQLNRTFFVTWITGYELTPMLHESILYKDVVKLALQDYLQSLTPERLDHLLVCSHRYMTRSDKSVIRAMGGIFEVKQLLESEPVVDLAVETGRVAERLDLLGKLDLAAERIRDRVMVNFEESEGGETGDDFSMPDWDIEYRHYYEHERFVETEIFPLLEPLGEPVFTTWVAEAGKTGE